MSRGDHRYRSSWPTLTYRAFRLFPGGVGNREFTYVRDSAQSPIFPTTYQHQNNRESKESQGKIISKSTVSLFQKEKAIPSTVKPRCCEVLISQCEKTDTDLRWYCTNESVFRRNCRATTSEASAAASGATQRWSLRQTNAEARLRSWLRGCCRNCRRRRLWRDRQVV